LSVLRSAARLTLGSIPALFSIFEEAEGFVCPSNCRVLRVCPGGVVDDQ
jgi:hypothetical protein